MIGKGILFFQFGVLFSWILLLHISSKFTKPLKETVCKMIQSFSKTGI